MHFFKYIFTNVNIPKTQNRFHDKHLSGNGDPFFKVGLRGTEKSIHFILLAIALTTLGVKAIFGSVHAEILVIAKVRAPTVENKYSTLVPLWHH